MKRNNTVDLIYLGEWKRTGILKKKKKSICPWFCNTSTLCELNFGKAS